MMASASAKLRWKTWLATNRQDVILLWQMNLKKSAKVTSLQLQWSTHLASSLNANSSLSSRHSLIWYLSRLFTTSTNRSRKLTSGIQHGYLKWSWVSVNLLPASIPWITISSSTVETCFPTSMMVVTMLENRRLTCLKSSLVRSKSKGLSRSLKWRYALQALTLTLTKMMSRQYWTDMHSVISCLSQWLREVLWARKRWAVELIKTNHRTSIWIKLLQLRQAA